jgi:D-xylose transport system permease protein
MSTAVEPPPAQVVEEERPSGINAYVRNWVDQVRGGELGSIPIIVGIVVIAIYMQARNSNFLTAGNFVNLIAQMSPFAVIGMGIVFVLLLGEIDLSVGYVSGMGGVLAAVLLQPDGSQWATWLAIAAALLLGTAIGLGQGFFVAKLGVPSFVVTLAGLLGWNGVVLQIIGSKGTIVIQDKFVNGLANDYVDHTLAWIIGVGTVLAWLTVQVLTVFRRKSAGLQNVPWVIIGARTLAVLAATIFVIEWADTDRGIPYVGLVMLGLLI